MLEYEWRELEKLCDRISDLRHRYSFAVRSRNVGLAEGIKEDITRARRQREDVVRHISARLGAVTSVRKHPSATAHHAPPDDAAATSPAPQAGSADGADDPASIIGFPGE